MARLETPMNRPLKAAALAALCVALTGARPGDSVTINYGALDRLPPRSSALGVAVPKLIPPGLLGSVRAALPSRPDTLSNLPSSTGATPPAAFETHEALYNATDAADGEASIATVFARSYVELSTPAGVSAATPQPARPAPASSAPIVVANAATDAEPVFVSWTRARTIGEVYFRTNGDSVNDIDRKSFGDLDQIARRIGSSQTRVLLRAFGGPAGDNSHEAHRVALRRGLAVRKYLMARGVPSICIDVNAMGGATDGGPLDRVDVMDGAT